MSALATWLDEHTGRAPAALAGRARDYALAAARNGEAHAEVSDVLAGAAHHALARVLTQPGDRSTALDLLAGDALVTLALLARAEAAPEGLGEFARALLRPEPLAP